MTYEKTFQDIASFRDAHLNQLIEACVELYASNDKRPVRILDLATGPNELNPDFVQNLGQRGINYNLVLTDISPTYLVIGWNNMLEALAVSELTRVKAVLADSRDLRRTLRRVRIYEQGALKLEDVLKQPKYDFLRTGHSGFNRQEEFKDESFDLVIGEIPYSSIGGGKDDYKKAIRESVRVLKHQGYHIFSERQVEQMGPIVRTKEALRGAKIKYVEQVRYVLSSLLSFSGSLSLRNQITNNSSSEEAVQNGDIVRDEVLVYRKK